MSEPSTQAKPAMPAPNPKVYDGSMIVSHPVQEGQTLSSIAQIYRFRSWKPIWIYNSQIEKTVGSDPSQIKKGTTIFIPRSKTGYAKIISKLDATRCILMADADVILAQLEGDMYNLEAYKVVIDTSADIFKTAVGIAFKAADAAKAAQVAKKAAAQARIAAYHAMRSDSRAVATKLAELASKRMKTAKDAASLSSKAAAQVQTSLQRKAVGAAAQVGDYALSATHVHSDKTYNLKNAHKAKETGRKVYNLIHSANKLLNISEIVLDYVKPSNLANAAILLSSGETVETTYEEQKKHVQKMAKVEADRIAARIAALRRESNLLYAYG